MNSTIEGTGRRSFFREMLPFFVVAHFAHHLLTAIPTPLLPFIRAYFGLSLTQSALVVTTFSFSSGFAQLPAGWLADRVGPRILVTVGICGVALGGLLVGLSHTYTMMLVFLVVMGVAAGGYHPAATPLISASVEPEKRGRALGFHLIGGSASFFLSPLVATAIAAVWGWHGSFIALAVPAAIFGLIFYKLLGRLGDTRVPRQKGSQSSQAGAAAGKRRRLVAFMVLVVTTGGIVFSAQAFIPLYFVDNFGISEQAAGSSLAIIYSAGLWASPLGGYLSDRLGRVPVILVTSILAGVILYLLPVAAYGLGTGAILFFLGGSNFTRMPAAEAYIMTQADARHRSTVYGIYYFAVQQTGAVFAPVMAYFVENYGYSTSFRFISAAVVGLTLILAPFLWGKET